MAFRTALAKVAVMALGAMASSAYAAEGACDTQATERKLAGAAKTSFVKKCTTDAVTSAATPRCETQAADKKLAGAAKTSFVTKCVTDATK
jgi:hypothetical protein